jgi:murein DD-endopeptidase MepM/ murein hydrolase activator NlpD
VPRQQPGRNYRGRRRLPKLPSKRYAAVVTTAFVGASVVALTAGAMDGLGTPGAGDPTTQAMSVEDRLNAIDKANRSEDRYGPAVNANQGAPDVWLMPLRANFQITTYYEQRWGTFHFGVDLACPEGTPFYASHAGTVKLARFNGGYGNEIELDNGNGILVIYGHASALLVSEGQHVEAGQLIGLVGTTGYSTGPHLHYEITQNGVEFDPMKFMKDRGVDIQNRQEAATGGTVIS